MRLLVTGGCGFIGSGFCRHIRKLESCQILVNIDCLYPCSSQAADLVTNTEKYIFVNGNITDGPLLQKILTEYNINTVVHFAAQSHVDTSFSDQLIYIHDNIIGTYTLLDACRVWGKITKFVHISTDEVYGENQVDDAFCEKSLLKPTNPYSASKASAEMFVNSYICSYNIPAVIIRSNNIYGPGQYPEKVIPKFILQLKDNYKLTIQGSGQQQRSFLYIDDAVDAILCVLEHGEVGEIYNISSKDEISIYNLAKTILEKIKPEANIEEEITFIPDRNFNDTRYWIVSHNLEALGWSQKVRIDQGLSQCIDWYTTVDTSNYWMNCLDVSQ